MDLFEKKVVEFIRENRLIASGARIVVALSGGADSVALAHFLSRCAKNLDCTLVGAVHFNHLLRGPESDADADFAAGVCNRLGIRFVGGAGRTDRCAAENKISIEQAGRRLRYDFFRMSRRMLSADSVALAHHADDNLETVLINLVRGTGARGIAGIPPARNGYIRPFLSVSKSEITEYLKSHRLEWRDDATNAEPIFLRNRIRRDIIPALVAENSNLARTVLRNSRLAAAEDEMLDRIAARKLDKISGRKKGRLTIKIKSLLDSDPVWTRRMIRLAIAEAQGDLWGISGERIEALLTVLNGKNRSATIEFSGGVNAEISYDKLIFTGRAPSDDRRRTSRKKKPAPSKTLELSGPTEFAGYIFSVKLLAESPGNLKRSAENEALINPAEIDGEMVLRTAKRGERIRAFGGGGKKISELYIDSKIPRKFRSERPLLADNSGALWLPGVARSNRACVTPGGGVCLLVKIIEQPE